MRNTVKSICTTLAVLALFSCKKDNFNSLRSNASIDNSNAETITSTTLVTYPDAIIANDLKTGVEDWRITAPETNFVTGPLVNGNTIYYVTATSIYKALVSPQQVIWHFSHYHGISMQDSVMPPVFSNGLIILASKFVGGETAGKAAAKIVAVDTATGKLVWSTIIKLKNDENRITAPTADQGKIYAGLGGYLLCMDAGSGTIVWKRKIAPKENFIMSPCVWNNTVYTATCKNLEDSMYAISAADGAEIWRAALSDSFVGTYNTIVCLPTVHNGEVLVNGHKKIASFNAMNGSKLWEYTHIYGGGIADDDVLKGITVTDRFSPNSYDISTTNWEGSVTINLYTDGSFHGTTKLGYHSTPGSFSAPVSVKYPSDAEAYIVYVRYAHDYSCFQLDGVFGSVWTLAGTKTILNVMITDSEGNVFYAAESGMQQ